jgi:acetolactate synthase-1/2/3 large subunit
VQTTVAPEAFAALTRTQAPTTDRRAVSDVAQLLHGERFALWVGFGARHAAPQVLRFAERYQTPVFSTPRGKGVFPESHLQYVGVTGLGGHTSVSETLRSYDPRYVLVLGTRLHESSSFWSPDYVPSGGFIHVEVDPSVPGRAYASTPTLAVEGEVGRFLDLLAEELPQSSGADSWLPRKPAVVGEVSSAAGRVRPEALMAAIQSNVIDGTDAIVIAESGNSFIWSQHHLCFDHPRRYRASTQVGSMGHAVSGVVGAADATGRKAFAITGDGSMLMNNEISTAVAHGIPAAWIVLNDGHYNMCRQGMASLGLSPADTSIPDTDFVAIARAMGGDGLRVESEVELKTAFDRALSSKLPFVLDVLIDIDAEAPSHGRNRRLAAER